MNFFERKKWARGGSGHNRNSKSSSRDTKFFLLVIQYCTSYFISSKELAFKQGTLITQVAKSLWCDLCRYSPLVKIRDECARFSKTGLRNYFSFLVVLSVVLWRFLFRASL